MRLLCFFLLFTFLAVIQSLEGEDGCLSQPKKIIFKKTGQSAHLQCTINSQCSHLDLLFRWFIFKENSHFEINKEQSKYSLEEASLVIKSVNMTDSGIYLCALISSQEEPAPAKQYIGLGTTLVVQETSRIMVRHILLWLSCILLAIYSVAIISLIIIKKHGCHQVCRKKSVSTEKKKSTKRLHFHDVLQELYKKRSLETNRQTRTKRLHIETAESRSSHDDVYQNV